MHLSKGFYFLLFILASCSDSEATKNNEITPDMKTTVDMSKKGDASITLDTKTGVDSNDINNDTASKADQDSGLKNKGYFPSKAWMYQSIEK